MRKFLSLILCQKKSPKVFWEQNFPQENPRPPQKKCKKNITFKNIPKKRISKKTVPAWLNVIIHAYDQLPI